jgi:hypothetical protein
MKKYTRLGKPRRFSPGTIVAEGPLANIALATIVSRFQPSELRDLVLGSPGSPPLVRSVVIHGCRMVALSDVLALSAIATRLPDAPDGWAGR